MKRLTTQFTVISLVVLMGLISCAPAPQLSTDGVQIISTSGATTTGSESVSQNTDIPPPLVEQESLSLTNTGSSSCRNQCEDSCLYSIFQCDDYNAVLQQYVSCDSVNRSDSRFTQCVSECMSTPWTLGGCADAVFNGPDGDNLVLFAGMKGVPFELSVCIQKEDALVVQTGIMTLITQKGSNLEDVMTKKDKFKDSAIDKKQLMMATAGNVVRHGMDHDTYHQQFERRAKIKIGDEEKEWPFPGAISFPIIRWLADADVSRPTRFVIESVDRDETNTPSYAQNRYKQVTQRHFRHYWGPEMSIDVVTLHRRPRDWGNTRQVNSCLFRLSGKFYYFPVQ